MDPQAYAAAFKRTFYTSEGAIGIDDADRVRARAFWDEWHLFVTLITAVDVPPLPADLNADEQWERELLQLYALARTAHVRVKQVMARERRGTKRARKPSAEESVQK